MRYATPQGRMTVPLPTYPEIRLALFPRKGLERLIVSFKLGKGLAAAGPRFGKISESGLAHDGPVETRNGIVIAADSNQRQAAIQPILDGVRRQGQSPIVVFDCLGMAADLAQHIAAMTVCLGDDPSTGTVRYDDVHINMLDPVPPSFTADSK